jgi:glycosyltransferase involved in cell wall biosynthesis
MRVLQVIHQFPPFSSQGSEMHCLQLGRALLGHGDSVGVFHLSNTTPRNPRRLGRGVFKGLLTFHCVDDGQYARLSDWPNPFLTESFRTTLAEFAPQVVHFHNYLSLGDDLVGMARASGAAVVYTLHDYGLICPNHLLLRSDGQLCGKCSPDFFGDCCPTTLRISGGTRPRLASRLPPLFRWRHFAENQPRAISRKVMTGLVQLGEALLGTPESTAVEAKKSFYLGATRRLLDSCQLLISPSMFLRERYLQCGVPADRIVYERYGLPHFPRPAQRPAPNGKLRFGYIGAFHVHKGIEVLLEAFRPLAARATLHLHGSSFGSPVSEAHFRKITADSSGGFVVHGSYNNDCIGEILGGLDAVVVPSIWYENSPLTIQEAQIAGVPVITADEGGMAELVRDGIDGLHFRLGDVAQLRRVLERVIERPAMLEAMRREAPAVPTIEEQAARIRRHYETALDLV